jgi:hypothetical protein
VVVHLFLSLFDLVIGADEALRRHAAVADVVLACKSSAKRQHPFGLP